MVCLKAVLEARVAGNVRKASAEVGTNSVFAGEILTANFAIDDALVQILFFV